MRRIHALVFSLSLLGAVAAGAARPPAACAQDPVLASACETLDKAQAKLDAMKPGDAAAQNEILKLVSTAVKRLNGCMPAVKKTEEWKAATERSKTIGDAAKAKGAEKPEAPAPTPPPPAPPSGGPPADGATPAAKPLSSGDAGKLAEFDANLKATEEQLAAQPKDKPVTVGGQLKKLDEVLRRIMDQAHPDVKAARARRDDFEKRVAARNEAIQGAAAKKFEEDTAKKQEETSKAAAEPDAALLEAKAKLDAAEAAIAAMKQGDGAEGKRIRGELGLALQLAGRTLKRSHPLASEIPVRQKALSAKLEERILPPAPTESDAPVHDAKKKLDELIVAYEAMKPLDAAEQKRIKAVLTKDVGPLLDSSKTKRHALWVECRALADRIEFETYRKCEGLAPASLREAGPPIDPNLPGTREVERAYYTLIQIHGLISRNDATVIPGMKDDQLRKLRGAHPAPERADISKHPLYLRYLEDEKATIALIESKSAGGAKAGDEAVIADALEGVKFFEEDAAKKTDAQIEQVARRYRAEADKLQGNLDRLHDKTSEGAKKAAAAIAAFRKMIDDRATAAVAAKDAEEKAVVDARTAARDALVEALGMVPPFGGLDVAIARPFTDASLVAWGKRLVEIEGKQAAAWAKVTPHLKSFELSLYYPKDKSLTNPLIAEKLNAGGREVQVREHLAWLERGIDATLQGARDDVAPSDKWDGAIKWGQNVTPKDAYRAGVHYQYGDEWIVEWSKRVEDAVAAAKERHKFLMAFQGKTASEGAAELAAALEPLESKVAAMHAIRKEVVAAARLPVEDESEPGLREIALKALADTEWGAAAWSKKSWTGVEKVFLLGSKKSYKNVEWVKGTLYNDDYDHFWVATLEKRGDDLIVYKTHIGFARSMTSLIHDGTSAPIGKWFIWPRSRWGYRILKENFDKERAPIPEE